MKEVLKSDLFNLQEKFNKIISEKKRMSFFDIVRPHETLVSEWLAFIFNPTVNGLGNKPVKLLLDAIGETIINLDNQEFIETKTEVSTDELRRIDILINYSNTLIVIENKIDSWENDDQTKYYYNYIESIKGNKVVKYIYLKPSYNYSEPSKKITFKENGFIVLTYKTLINKLNMITTEDYSEEEKYKYKYISGFTESGERFMNEFDINDKVNFYINNIDKLDQIVNEYNNQNELLYKKIRDDVLEVFDSDLYKTCVAKDYIQFYKEKWAQYAIHYEILFNQSKILGRETKVRVVLHIEGNIGEDILKRFNENGIIKNKSSVPVDSIKNYPIQIDEKCEFTDIKKVNESIEKIKNAIGKLKEEYENKIDKAIIKSEWK